MDASEKWNFGVVSSWTFVYLGVARAEIEMLPQEHADVALPRAVVSDDVLKHWVGFSFFRRGHSPTEVGLIE